MTEGGTSRLIAWSQELRAVHERLRDALQVTRETLHAGDPVAPATRDLLLFCHGFCTALAGHHHGEDRELFPAVLSAHPELAGTLGPLQADHTVVAALLDDLDHAVSRCVSPAEVDRHLDGIAAIMENHFRHEERQLFAVLDTLALDADPAEVLGPLWDGG